MLQLHLVNKNHAIEKMIKGSLKERIKRLLIGITIFIFIYLLFIILYLYPHIPKDFIGWLVLIFIGIPIFLLFEMIGNFLTNKKLGSKISEKKFSFKRILISIFIVILFISITFYVMMLLNSFFGNHFN